MRPHFFYMRLLDTDRAHSYRPNFNYLRYLYREGKKNDEHKAKVVHRFYEEMVMKMKAHLISELIITPLPKLLKCKIYRKWNDFTSVYCTTVMYLKDFTDSILYELIFPIINSKQIAVKHNLIGFVFYESVE